MDSFHEKISLTLIYNYNNLVYEKMLFLIYGVPVYVVVATLSFVVSGRIAANSEAIKHYVFLRMSGIALGIALYHLSTYLIPSFFGIKGNPFIIFVKPFFPSFLLGSLLLVLSLTISNRDSHSKNVIMQLSIGVFWSVCVLPFWGLIINQG